MFRLLIKEVALEKGIEQNKLAKLAGLNIKTIRRLYNNPYAEVFTYTLDKIATALAVDPRELIGPDDKDLQEGTRSE